MNATLQDITLPDDVRAAVTNRDSRTCLGCGKTGEHTIMPRSPERSLGTAAGWVTLCGTPEKPGTCAWKAAEDSDESRFRGYVLGDDQDPATEPVMIFSPGGSGVTMLLTPGGRYEFREAA